MSSPSLHLCYLCNEYPPAPHGGIGSFTQTLGREMVKLGHRVTVVGLYPDEHATSGTDAGVVITRLSRKGPPLIRFLTNRRKLAAELWHIHRDHPIDIIESGELDLYAVPPSFPALLLLRMHGGPTFFETGDRLQRWKERRSFQVADELCAVSHCVADGTRRMLGLRDRHVEVIYNPIDTQVFAPDPHGLPEEDGLIVFAGTVSERKGIVQLIQAMPRIAAEVPGVRLEVYGGEAIDPAPPRPLVPRLLAMLPPEVARRVDFKGRVPRSVLPQAIQRASVCVYPSHFEAMPLAWLEGLAAGKAVVASQTGPGPEVIQDGVTGLLCDPLSPDSIAAALIRVLHDPQLRQTFGTNARRNIMQTYELNAIVRQNEHYYRRLASNNKGREL